MGSKIECYVLFSATSDASRPFGFTHFCEAHFLAMITIKIKLNSYYKNELNLELDFQVAVLQNVKTKLENHKACSITLLSPKIVV